MANSDSPDPQSGASRRDLSLNPTARVPVDAWQDHGFDGNESAGFFLGVSEYDEDPSIAPIPYAVDDAIDLAWMFSEVLGLIPASRVQLCLGGHPKKPRSQEQLNKLLAAGAKRSSATRIEVYRGLGTAAAQCGPAGLIVTSIATHGFHEEGADYILTGDSLRTLARRTAIPLTDIEDELGSARTRRRILLVDACREQIETGSSRRVGGGLAETFAESLGSVDGAVVLSAAVSGGFAYDDDESQNGLFTRAILEGLSGQATPDESGYIRAAHLAKFVEGRVREWVLARYPGMNAPVGIQYSAAGEGAKLPLAINAEIHARYVESTRSKSLEERTRDGLSFLSTLSAWPGFTEQILRDIRAALLDGPGQEKEQLLRRLERLRQDGPDFAPDFIGWWNLRRGAVSAEDSGRPSAQDAIRQNISVDLDTIVSGGVASCSLETSGETRRLEVFVPRWAKEGDTLRLPSEGPAGEDVLLSVQYIPGRRFWLQDNCLAVEASVPYLLAYEGGEASLAVGEETIRFAVPAGSTSGKLFGLNGYGLLKEDGTRGPLVIRLLVERPRSAEESADPVQEPSSQEMLDWRPAEGGSIPGRPNWTIVRKLGEGGFGEAWLVTQPITGENSVLKFCFDPEHVRSLKREVKLLRALYDDAKANQYFARVINWSLENPPYYVEFRYYEMGSLLDYAERIGGLTKIPLKTRLELLSQVACGLTYAHDMKILHRDVKPSNILLTKNKSGKLQAVLSDFGIGRSLDRQIFAAKNVTATGLTTSGSGLAGTGIYLAPELLEGKPPEVTSDVYAFGVTMYQVLSGDLSRAIGHGWEEHIGSEELCELIALCINVNPRYRLDRADIIHKRLATKARARINAKQERMERRTFLVGSVIGLAGLGAVGWIAKEFLLSDVEFADINQPYLNFETPAPPVNREVVPPTPVPRTTSETKTFNINDDVSMRLVYIPPGSFFMGSSEEERAWVTAEMKRKSLNASARPGESPQTEVILSSGFWMAETPVTLQQYMAVMGMNPTGGPAFQAPVHTVSMRSAIEFCSKLGKIINQEITLPTEAQWEYACRAGTTTKWYFGDDDAEIRHYANIRTGYKRGASFVKKLIPNDWGLYDMHGNVWEMTSSYWVSALPGGTQRDYHGPSGGDSIVTRGGAYNCLSYDVRSASKKALGQGARNDQTGFRIISPA